MVLIKGNFHSYFLLFTYKILLSVEVLFCFYETSFLASVFIIFNEQVDFFA